MRDPKDIMAGEKSLAEILSAHAKWVMGEGGERANLRGANLIDANLIDANLEDANLEDANLIDANLRGANLIDANLRNANLEDANLRDVNLRDANLEDANLIDANLWGANLIDANLRNANLDIPFTPDPDLIKKVAAAALAGANGETPHLEMNDWHTCETTHCIAGWAITLHPEGKLLERFTSPYLAARLLLGDEAAKRFFDSNQDARAYLEQFLSEDAKK